MKPLNVIFHFIANLNINNYFYFYFFYVAIIYRLFITISGSFIDIFFVHNNDIDIYINILCNEESKW